MVRRSKIHRRHESTSQSDLSKLIGLLGEARTEIDPSGTIYVGGENWSARADKKIHIGAQVKVIKREGLVLFVEPSSHEK